MIHSSFARAGAACAPLLLLLLPTLARGQPGVADVTVPVGAGATVTRPAATVELRASEPQVTYQIRSGEGRTRGRSFDVYSPICEAPCAATLPVGTNRLAISVDGSTPVEPSEPVSILGPSRLEAKHISHAHVRYIGWGVFFGGAIAGAAIMATSRTTESRCIARGMCVDDDVLDKTRFFVGAGTLSLGMVVGGILALQGDSAEIAVVPLHLGSHALGARREGAAQALDGTGLGLRMRF